METATAQKTPSNLDNLPNELIQKIWVWSGNWNLPLCSRRLHASLDGRLVQDLFYRALATSFLKETLPNKPGEEYKKWMEKEHITAELMTTVLDRSGITNAELEDLTWIFPLATTRFLDQILNGGPSWYSSNYVLLRVPRGTWIPHRLLRGHVTIYIDRIDLSADRTFWEANSPTCVFIHRAFLSFV